METTKKTNRSDDDRIAFAEVLAGIASYAVRRYGAGSLFDWSRSVVIRLYDEDVTESLIGVVSAMLPDQIVTRDWLIDKVSELVARSIRFRVAVVDNPNLAGSGRDLAALERLFRRCLCDLCIRYTVQPDAETKVAYADAGVVSIFLGVANRWPTREAPPIPSSDNPSPVVQPDAPALNDNPNAVEAPTTFIPNAIIRIAQFVDSSDKRRRAFERLTPAIPALDGLIDRALTIATDDLPLIPVGDRLLPETFDRWVLWLPLPSESGQQLARTDSFGTWSIPLRGPAIRAAVRRLFELPDPPATEIDGAIDDDAVRLGGVDQLLFVYFSDLRREYPAGVAASDAVILDDIRLFIGVGGSVRAPACYENPRVLVCEGGEYPSVRVLANDGATIEWLDSAALVERFRRLFDVPDWRPADPAPADPAPADPAPADPAPAKPKRGRPRKITTSPALDPSTGAPLSVQLSDIRYPSDATVYEILHSRAGTVERWDRARASGLTNGELLAAIGDVIGAYLGGNNPEPFVAKGGLRPAIWYGFTQGANDMALRGRELVATARRVLGVKRPAEVNV